MTLTVDATKSGPLRDEVDPFTSGDADVGFVCAPPYSWLRARTPSPIELIEAACLFDDPRAAGAPVYFSDVIVAASSPVASADELTDAKWAYNDAGSLSGYYSLPAGVREGRPQRLVRSGSHLESIALVAAGKVDAAAIDSNALALALKRDDSATVKVVATWGPYPIQPIVARAELGAAMRNAMAVALLEWEPGPELGRFGVRGFAPVTPGRYPEGGNPSAPEQIVYDLAHLQADHEGLFLNGYEFRMCLGCFGTGVTIVTVEGPSEPRGLTVNAFTSVSLDPPLVLISINKLARSHVLLVDHPFAINIMAVDQEALALHFAGKHDPNLTVPWERGLVAPYLSGTVAVMECESQAAYDGGDHTLFLGRVVAHRHRDGDALGYFRSRFVSLSEPVLVHSPGTLDPFELPYDTYE